MMSCTEGEGVHDIVMTRDVGRLCDITHITSAARSGQGVVDDSASIQELISTYQNFNILCLLLQMSQMIQKQLCCVRNSYTSVLCRLHYRLQRGC